MKKELSVLIPTYNSNCSDLVFSVHGMLKQLNIPYEIVVADDGLAAALLVVTRRLAGWAATERQQTTEIRPQNVLTNDMLRTFIVSIL